MVVRTKCEQYSTLLHTQQVLPHGLHISDGFHVELLMNLLLQADLCAAGPYSELQVLKS